MESALSLVTGHPYVAVLLLFAAVLASSASVRNSVFVGTTYVTLTMWYQYRQVTKGRRESTATAPPPTMSTSGDTGSAPPLDELAIDPVKSTRRSKPRSWAD
ncbi:hypothetical protein H257_13040 [Aphanomyces astaci]|uniref:Uncharacterized protein n=1 Tax=Aphanomyces astaci TaxID=112090 RepID=W4FWK4_APHAT|nr:hypothetical protein H257_13040 [Aphanomyces astaci]ETV71910.1 hypothetical protein H257_13040 [Aphanomyces astaci]|eukprot:XP_009838759.1 hypothetical protein H257_13040 [Aphanomyces astaci]